MKISPPSSLHSKPKRSVVARLLGVGKTKEHMTSRQIKVRANDPGLVQESIQSTKQATINSKEAEKLRKKLGLLKEKKSVKHLYNKLVEEANSDTDDEVKKYEEEQTVYEESNEIVDVNTSKEVHMVELKYKSVPKKPKVKVPTRKKQKIEVEVHKEGTYTSIDDKMTFHPVHHDPDSYDWSSEEGYVAKKKPAKKKAAKKKAVKKAVKKKTIIKKKPIKKAISKKAVKKTRSKAKASSVVRTSSKKTTKKVGKRKK